MSVLLGKRAVDVVTGQASEKDAIEVAFDKRLTGPGVEDRGVREYLNDDKASRPLAEQTFFRDRLRSNPGGSVVVIWSSV